MSRRLVALAALWLALVGAAPQPLDPPPPDLAPLVPWAAAPLDKPPVPLPRVPLPAPPVDLPLAPSLTPEPPAAPKPMAPLPPPRALPCVGAWLGIASESLECGRARLSRGEWEEAARALEGAVRVSTDRELQTEARYWLAEALYRLGQVERADWLFRQVAQEHGRRDFGPWALHASGWTALRLGDAARAREAFERLLQAPQPPPLDVWGRHGLALALYGQGRYEEASRLWAELAGRRLGPPLDREVLLWQADTAGRLGRPVEAVDGLARFVQGGEHPLLGPATIRLGWWLLRAERPADAVQTLRQVLAGPLRAHVTERDWAEAGLALALAASGDARGAREVARALEGRRAPLATPVRLRLALAALEAGQAADAQAVLQDLLAGALAPGLRPWVLALRGEAHRLEGARDEARTQFELARAAAPATPTGRFAGFRLAQMAFDVREFARAVAELEPLVSPPGGDELARAARVLQAEAAYHAGQYARASQAYERALAAAPEGPEAPALRLALAWTALRQRRLEEARQHFLEFARTHPSDPHAPDALVLAAELALEQGALEPARELLDRVLADHPTHPRAEFARLNRALLLLRTGQAAAAQPILVDWIARAPFPPLVGRAWAALGAARLAAGDAAGAAQAFERARAEGVGALAALGLGVAALAQRRLDDAAREFQLARDTGTVEEGAVADYGRALVAFHRRATAEFRQTAEALLKAAPRGPAAPGLLYALAGLAAEAGDWPAALAAARRLVGEFPAHEAADDALERVGAAAAAAREWRVAVEVWELLRQQYPRSPFVEASRVAWGRALLETGRPAEARRALEEALAAAGTLPPEAWVALGRAREATGDAAGALEAFGRAGTGARGWDREATRAHARVLAGARRWEEARRTLTPLLRSREPSEVADAAVAVADTYQAEGQPLAAAEFYLTAAYLVPDTPAGRRALLAAARALADARQPDAAAALYRKLLAQPDLPSDLAAAARQGLRELKR